MSESALRKLPLTEKARFLYAQQRAKVFNPLESATIELVGIDAFTEDSPTKEVSGSPSIYSNFLVVPEFLTWHQFLLTFLASFIIVIILNKKIAWKKTASKRS
jgi:hypothetical protein